MRKKEKTGNGVKLALAVSMVGLGIVTSSPSSTKAMENQDVLASQSTAQATNTLADLEIQGITLDHAFSPDEVNYTANVDNSVQNISFAKSDNSKAKITINNLTVTNGTAAAFTLLPGDNKFVISVDNGTDAPKTYTLIVTRKQAADTVEQNINLSIDMLTPSLTGETAEYNVTVPNAVSSITVLPETADKTATITVKSGNEIIDPGKPVQLTAGATTDITISVKRDNDSENNYLFHVTREAASTNPGGGTTGSTTGGTHTGSTGGTHGGTTGGTHTGSTGGTHGGTTGGTHVGSTGGTHGGTTRGTYGGTAGGTHSGTTRGTIGGTTGGTRTTSGSYGNGNFQTSSTPAQKTSTALLSSLTVSNGTWNTSFTANKYTYHIAETSDIKSVAINPSPEYSSASISIQGSSSNTVQLTGNPTVVEIVVTRGTDRKTYVLIFDKPVQPPSTTVSVSPDQSSTSSDSSSISSSQDKVSASGSTPPASVTSVSSNSGRNKSFWQSIIDFFKNLF